MPLSLEEMVGTPKPSKRAGRLSLEEMQRSVPQVEDPDAGFPAARAFGTRVQTVVRGFQDVHDEAKIQISEAGKTRGLKAAMGAVLDSTDRLIIGGVKAAATGLVSLGELAMQGMAVPAGAIEGAFKGGGARQHPTKLLENVTEGAVSSIEDVQLLNEKIRELVGGFTKLSLAPENEEEKAMHDLLFLLPEGLHALGETVYEKTGWAIAGAGVEAAGAYFLLKPTAAAKTLEGIRRAAGGSKRGPGGGPGGPSPKGPNKVSAAFDELAAVKPEVAKELAEHVSKADQQLGELMAERVETMAKATPEELKAVGRAAAQQRLLTHEKKLYVNEKGEVSSTLRPTPRGFQETPAKGTEGHPGRVASAQRIEGGTTDVLIEPPTRNVSIEANRGEKGTVKSKRKWEYTNPNPALVEREVSRALEAGKQVSVLHEMHSTPRIIKSVDEVKGSTADQIFIRELASTKQQRQKSEKISSKLREIQLGKEPEILMAGDVGVEITPVEGGFKLSVIREGEITPLETFPTRNLAKAFADELLQKQGVKDKLRVVPGGKLPAERVPLAEATPDKYPTLPEARKAVDAVEGPPKDGMASSMAEVSKTAGEPVVADKPKAGMEDPGYVDLNMGIPIKLSDLKAAFDLARTYVPGVALAEGKVKAYWDATLRTVAPESRSPEAKRAGAIIASRVAEQGLAQAMVHGPASQKRSSYWNMHPEQAERFILEGESGKPFNDPVLDRAAAGYRAWNEKMAKRELELGITFDPLENYLYHVFKDGPGVQKHFERRSGVKWGQPGFIKDRVFRNYKEALDQGFEPKFSNPEDIMQARQHSHDVAVAKVEMLQELVDYGLAVKVQKGETIAPDGYAASPRRSPDGQHYWVHVQANTILHNLYDTKSLWTMGLGKEAGLGEMALGTSFRGGMFLKNSVVPIILSASGFHGLHVLTIDNVPGAIRAVKEWAGHARSVSSAIGRVAAGFAYIDLLRNPIEGGRINRIIRGKIPEEKWTEADKVTLQLMMEGGFVPLQSHVYKTTAISNFRGAIEKAIGAGRVGRTGQAVEQSSKVIFHAPFAAIQLLQKPMFDLWIPNLKAAAYSKDAAAALKADPTLLQDAGRRKEILRRIAKSVDNRYGEMAYDTLFWNRTVKDIGVGASLSLGWNLGFLREYGGAPMDLVASYSKTSGQFEGRKPTARERIARGDYDKTMFITMYSAQAMMYAALMTYMMTGEPPKELLDYTHPRIGETNPDGSEKRVNTMFYPREFVSIAKHIEQEGAGAGIWNLVASKAAPTLGMVQAWATGMDSLGREIRDPDGSPYQKLQQTLLHTLYEMEPISVDALRQEMSQDKGKSAILAVSGFAPAAQYITATPTEAAIKGMFLKYHGQKRTPYEKAEQSDESRKLRRHYQNYRMAEYAELLSEMEQRFELSPGEIRRLERSIESDENPLHKMFSRLDWRHQRTLMDKMTQEELEVYQPLSNKEHLRFDYVPKDQRQ